MARILAYSRAKAPRFTRGSKTVLGDHAFVTAFDIDAAWNALGARPAPCQPGCLRDVVPVANDLGVYWGDHFRPPRRDALPGGGAC